MKPFLEQLAADIYKKYHDQLDQLTLVFPNRRAGLFFRKHLAEMLDKPIWSPAIISLEDFVQQFSTIRPLDKLSLVFQLFHIYNKALQNRKQPPEVFDRFYYWGDMLVKDFDDIDKYLISAKDLFIDIQHQKELDIGFDYLSEQQLMIIRNFWKDFHQNPSDEKEKFIKIWQILTEVYEKFTQSLIKQHQGYMGMIYRDVVNKIDNEEIETSKTPIVFAGFNALTLAEERIITWFLKFGKAEIIWDLDQYYVEGAYQEAGVFFREYKTKAAFKGSFPDPIPNNLSDVTKKSMQMTGVSMSVGQAKIMGQDLATNCLDGDDLEKTVIILPEEHLLFPVLHSLPEVVNRINVTMGFPLKNTPLYSLFEHLLELQIYIRKGKDKLFFPHRQVLAILKHPLVRNYNLEKSEKNIFEIERFNKILINEEAIHMDELLYPLIFKQVNEGKEIFSYLMDILLVINQQAAKKEDGSEGVKKEESRNEIEKEYAFQFFTQLNKLKEISELQRIELPVNAFLRLFRQLVQSLRMPFTGEPLQGLQIMGVLETRNLDFDNVYILSMNEGAFPAAANQHSFIPYNLRKAYNLPTNDHQDAIYAYLFYRVIQKAKNVHFYYNSENGINKGGEMSRFLKQLIYESDYDIKSRVLNNKVALSTARPIVISKSDTVMQTMRRFLVNDSEASKRLTPSAVNTYLDCSLKFYLRYVAAIREADTIEDEIDPRVFGNILHNTMEYLYKSYIQKKGSHHIEESDFDALTILLKNAINFAFNKQFSLLEENIFQFEGRNIIVRSMVEKFAAKIIDFDKAYAPFEIIGLEATESEGYLIDLPIVIDGVKEKVGMKGIIDRIDKKGDVIRVIDYKTGKDQKKIENIASLFDPDNKNRNKAAMQTIFYSLLYLENKTNLHTASSVTPGIYNSREMFEKSFDLRLHMMDPEKKNRAFPINDVGGMLKEFQEHLVQLVEKIFSREEAFIQTTDEKKCTNCPYKEICHR